MKKFLLSVAVLVSTLVFNYVNAQCTISGVSLTPTNVDPNTCTVTFNLTFTADVNNGAKYTIVHLWNSTSYPSPAPTQNSYPMLTAATANMLGTLVISNPGGTTPTLLSAWPTGGSSFNANTTPSTPILTGGFTWSASGTSRIYNFTNISMHVPNCSQTVLLTGDVWATQNANNASCASISAISNVTANDPGMRTLLNCGVSPRTFTVSFNSLSTRNITFSAYVDANNNGILDPSEQTAGKLSLSGSGISGSTTDVTINAQASAINVYTTYGPYTWPQSNGNKDNLIIVANAAGNNYNNISAISNSCAALPVSFSSISATRTKQNVLVKWQTASEVNNRGFYVQRQVGADEWKNVAFVFSAATNGNSSGNLSYSFNDLNTYKGISNYRIQQVDMDGNAKYSEVRSVRSEDMPNKLLVFPNPSINGKVSVVFDDAASLKDVIVSDVTGRVVKQYSSVSGSTMEINVQHDGFYSIQVIDRTSGAMSVEKVVIKMR
jgi:hypothetical protein